MHGRCLSAVVVGLFAVFAAPIGAQNRFFIDDVTVSTGDTGVELFLETDNDVTVFGFSFGLEYDGSAIEITSVSWEGALAQEPSFFDGIIENNTGRLGFGCVFDFGPEFDNVLAPGSDQTISRIIFDVVALTDTETTLQFAEVPFNPERPVKNILTNDQGLSEFPVLENGTVTIETRAPEIDSITGNSGFEGAEFTVNGAHFDESGLAVTVCDVAAAHVVNPDGTQLTVTAPGCGSFGFAELVITTDRGSASAANGFEYLVPAPEIVLIENGAGFAGDEFTIIADNVDQPGLVVMVCEVPAAASLGVDGRTITVTAPECASAPGAVDVEVCTVNGCAVAAGGFVYNEANAPEVSGIDPAMGPAGTVVTISGSGFAELGLEVTFCNLVVPASLEGETIVVTAPDCGVADGPVTVRVCTDNGCDDATFEFVAGGIFLRGNVNSDDNVNLSDAVYLLNFLFAGGDEPTCEDAADANDDGSADLSDPIYILNFLFAGGDDIPEPFPNPGSDPTPDELESCAP